MRISDWSSDVCSSDLLRALLVVGHRQRQLLPALLVFASEAERRRAQPRQCLAAQAVQVRTGLFEPLLETLQPRPAHTAHEIGEGIAAGRFHHSLPRRGNLGRARLPAAELRSDLLHLPEPLRPEEHTSELQSLMRISYAVL